MLLKLYILIFLNIILCADNNNDNNCILLTNKSIKKNQFIRISKFDSLNQLKFNCLLPINISMLEFRPNNPIILDETLNLTGLKIYSAKKDFSIALSLFKGFCVKQSLLTDILSLAK